MRCGVAGRPRCHRDRGIRTGPPDGPAAPGGGARARRAARAGGVASLTRRRPTVPRLETQYHGRWGLSRPSSGWDRVLIPPPWPPGRRSHAAAPPRCRRGEARRARVLVRPCGRARACVCVCRASIRRGGRPARGGRGWLLRTGRAVGRGKGPRDRRCRAVRAIRTGRLSASRRVHPRPIHVVVYHGPRGDPVSRGGSRLDAFSGSPVRTWPPGRAAGATTGAPEVRPSRSSRTGDGSSQVSNARGR